MYIILRLEILVLLTGSQCKRFVVFCQKEVVSNKIKKDYIDADFMKYLFFLVVSFFALVSEERGCVSLKLAKMYTEKSS